EKDYLNDIMSVTENKSDELLASYLVDNSYSTILWLKEQGVEFELNENQCFERNRVLKFWGGLPIKTKNKGIGLIEALSKTAKNMDVNIRYRTKAIELESTSNKISGIYVKSENKSIYKINTQAVILACGGFESSKKKRKKYLGSEWENAKVRG